MCLCKTVPLPLKMHILDYSENAAVVIHKCDCRKICCFQMRMCANKKFQKLNLYVQDFVVAQMDTRIPSTTCL